MTTQRGRTLGKGSTRVLWIVSGQKRAVAGQGAVSSNYTGALPLPGFQFPASVSVGRILYPSYREGIKS